MKRASMLISGLVAGAALVSPATSAYAQQTLFVAATGTNGTCTTVADACLSIELANFKLNADGGIIKCAGPVGHFARFVITRSVTIDCSLGGGGIHTQSVQINAPGKTVILQDVDVNCTGFCAFGAGIDIVAAASVTMQNVKVGGVPASNVGIYDHRPGPAYLVIENSKVAGSGGPGIVVGPNGGNIGAVLDNVRSNNNTYGLGVGAGGRVMIKRSVFSANSVAGIQGDTGANIGINETLISHNSIGVNALNGANITVSNSDVDSNNTAFSGVSFSTGNNRVFFNLNPGTFPTTIGSASSDFGQR